MRRTIAKGLLALLLLSHSASANAGIYTDDLSRCLVKATSADDNNRLIRWIFAAMSANPSIKSMTSITLEQREAYLKDGISLLERLVIQDCHTEAVAAFKYEGSAALGTSFQVLGTVAGRGLMTDPAAAGELQRSAKYLSPEKWNALGQESGLAAPLMPPATK